MKIVNIVAIDQINQVRVNYNMGNEDIKTARRCMDFTNIKCDNKDCINEFCPLNKIWDSSKP